MESRLMALLFLHSIFPTTPCVLLTTNCLVLSHVGQRFSRRQPQKINPQITQISADFCGKGLVGSALICANLRNLRTFIRLINVGLWKLKRVLDQFKVRLGVLGEDDFDDVEPEKMIRPQFTEATDGHG
jgi:hypothetical protein